MNNDKKEENSSDTDRSLTATFTSQSALSYDTRIPRLVPGYETLQEIVPSLLSEMLGDNASVLIIGAGTGKELINLAILHPNWFFTAVDPSSGMLDFAKNKAIDSSVEDRITFQVAKLSQYTPSHQHDAVICLLVTHFIPDTDEKDGFFQDVSRCLKQNAPFVFADLTVCDAPPKWAAYKNWVLSNGTSSSEVETMFARFTQNSHPIGDTRLIQLLNSTGFLDPTCFFQALDYRGFYTIKSEG